MSKEEDTYLNSLSGGKTGWLGGTILKNSGTVSGGVYSSFDTTGVVNSGWYWACGPEIGTTFYDTNSLYPDAGQSNAATVDASNTAYYNWARGTVSYEPNNQTATRSSTDADYEACLTTLEVAGNTGKHGTVFSWNDKHYTKAGTGTWEAKGYFVEYGNQSVGDDGSGSTSFASANGTLLQPSSDATLKTSSTVKGQQVAGLGTPNSNLGSETAGSVTITSAQAADTSNAGAFITLFDKNESHAAVKVVKYASGASVGNFTTDAAYANEAITDGDFFIVKVTAQDDITVNYYKIVVTVTSVATPTVTSISPASGPTAGGTSVVITGTDLTGATAVKFGSIDALSYIVDSATQITATSPSGSAGAVDITVTTAVGTSATSSSDRFTYETPSNTPLSAPADLAWDSQTPGKATWSPVDHAVSYNVQLKNGGNNAGNAQSVTQAVYEFAAAITANGYGSYTFAVTAIGDGTTYSNSQTVVSGVYEYGAFSSPLCSVLGIVSPANAVLDGLNISAGISHGTTAQQIDVTVSDNATWKLFSDSGCTNEITDKTMTLAVGGNTTYLKVTAQDGATTKIYTVTITRRGSSGDDGSSSDSGSSSGASGTTPDSGANVVVNGESQSAGTLETATDPEGRTVTTVTVDTEKLNRILETKGNNATVTISATTGSNMVTGVLTGQMIKNMEQKEATLVVKTDSAAYTVPAAEINIDAVSEQLGQNVTLADITVEMTIAEPSAQAVAAAEKAAADSGFSIVVPAVEFTISCTYNGTTVDVSKFNTYVERTIALPEGADPNKITTGIVVKPDGTTYHVPTRVTLIDGKYYAVINSLTNSTYTVVWHPLEFADVANHWAREAVNDMGSRMVVSGVDQENYAPDRDITRAEFAAIMVKALGLAPGTGKNRFGDVEDSEWYCEYIKTASSYDLIYGYGQETFGPDDTITREQAMTMIARAMKMTGLTLTLTGSDVSTLIGAYTDGASASDYAEDSIAACLKVGIVAGAGDGTIAPKNNATRAEVAVMVERLLEKSELI